MEGNELKVDVKLVNADSTEVVCRATNCKHNLAHDPLKEQALCRMKFIYLVNGGKCEQYELLKKEN